MATKVLGPGPRATPRGFVDNPDGTGTAYNGVTIENGTISNFDTDIDIEGTANSGSPPPLCSRDLTGAVVKGITTTNDTLQESYGVYGACLSGASIHNVSINDAEDGIGLIYSQASTVSSNHLQSPLYAMYDDEGDRQHLVGQRPVRRELRRGHAGGDHSRRGHVQHDHRYGSRRCLRVCLGAVTPLPRMF